MVVSQTFHISVVSFLRNFSFFNKCHYFSLTQFISQCIPLIPSWINCIWVKSPFTVISFDISTPLHQSACKACDYKNCVFHLAVW